jgi:hypothetical protein
MSVAGLPLASLCLAGTGQVAPAVAPGGAMVLMVQGLVQVQVDPSAGAIQAGDQLAAGEAGVAVKAQQVTLEAQVPFY